MIRNRFAEILVITSENEDISEKKKISTRPIVTESLTSGS